MTAKSSDAVFESDSERLDAVVYYLQRLDKRDKLRTIGGFFRALIMLIPTLLVLWSAVYFYQHGDEFLKKIASITTNQVSQFTQQHAGDFTKQLQDAMKGRGSSGGTSAP
ncbi:hypothetical protein HY285_01810 [Candidatus Peregrinibacteria bacterium]|nr:hypothetical protein [Candidatus Peregrinibacteria bacterium]MBI3816263.1 hypothetical protein [Candidatus Peregrinibacteria bacterium]